MAQLSLTRMSDPNWVSAIFAALAFGLSLLAHFSSVRSKKRTDALEEKSVELADLQNRLAHMSWSDTYFREIVDWASRVVSAISKGIHISDYQENDVRTEVLSELSACIDMGRWYFPNREHESRGLRKEPAYRGVRQPALDWIVYAYDIIKSRDSSPTAISNLVECQRNFVSAIQAKIDPRSREASVEQVLTDFAPVARHPKISSPPDDR